MLIAMTLFIMMAQAGAPPVPPHVDSRWPIGLSAPWEEVELIFIPDGSDPLHSGGVYDEVIPRVGCNRTPSAWTRNPSPVGYPAFIEFWDPINLDKVCQMVIPNPHVGEGVTLILRFLDADGLKSIRYETVDGTPLRSAPPTPSSVRIVP